MFRCAHQDVAGSQGHGGNPFWPGATCRGKSKFCKKHVLMKNYKSFEGQAFIRFCMFLDEQAVIKYMNKFVILFLFKICLVVKYIGFTLKKLWFSHDLSKSMESGTRQSFTLQSEHLKYKSCQLQNSSIEMQVLQSTQNFIFRRSKMLQNTLLGAPKIAPNSVLAIASLCLVFLLNCIAETVEPNLNCLCHFSCSVNLASAGPFASLWISFFFFIQRQRSSMSSVCLTTGKTGNSLGI